MAHQIPLPPSMDVVMAMVSRAPLGGSSADFAAHGAAVKASSALASNLAPLTGSGHVQGTEAGVKAGTKAGVKAGVKTGTKVGCKAGVKAGAKAALHRAAPGAKTGIYSSAQGVIKRLMMVRRSGVPVQTSSVPGALAGELLNNFCRGVKAGGICACVLVTLEEVRKFADGETTVLWGLGAIILGTAIGAACAGAACVAAPFISAACPTVSGLLVLGGMVWLSWSFATAAWRTTHAVARRIMRGRAQPYAGVVATTVLTGGAITAALVFPLHALMFCTALVPAAFISYIAKEEREAAALVTPHYGAGLEEIPAAEIPAAQPVPMPEIVAPEPEPLLAIPLPEVPEVLQDALQCPIAQDGVIKEPIAVFYAKKKFVQTLEREAWVEWSQKPEARQWLGTDVEAVIYDTAVLSFLVSGPTSIADDGIPHAFNATGGDGLMNQNMVVYMDVNGLTWANPGEGRAKHIMMTKLLEAYVEAKASGEL